MNRGNIHSPSVTRECQGQRWQTGGEAAIRVRVREEGWETSIIPFSLGREGKVREEKQE